MTKKRKRPRKAGPEGIAEWLEREGPEKQAEMLDMMADIEKESDPGFAALLRAKAKELRGEK